MSTVEWERIRKLAEGVRDRAGKDFLSAVNHVVIRALELGLDKAELEFECEYPDFEKVEEFLGCKVPASVRVHAQCHSGSTAWVTATGELHYVVAVPYEPVPEAMKSWTKNERDDGGKSTFFLFTPVPFARSTMNTLSEALPEGESVWRQNDVVLLLTGQGTTVLPAPGQHQEMESVMGIFPGRIRGEGRAAGC